MIDSQYLNFVEISDPKKKTKTISVRSAKHGVELGTIKWYGAWRQYCFWPEGQTIFNKGCMNDILKCIDLLMAERKNERKK